MLLLNLRPCTGSIAPALPGNFHSLDHLVGDCKQPWRYLDAQRSRRLKLVEGAKLVRPYYRHLWSSSGCYSLTCGRAPAQSRQLCLATSTHSITSSAIASSPGGTSMPSARAV